MNVMHKALIYLASIMAILSLVVGVAMISNELGLFDLLASTSLSGATTTVFFTPYGNETLSEGSTTEIDININTRVPINALGATISYATDTLEIVGIDKQKSFFDLWTEDTSIAEQQGLVHFSGGTTKKGGLTGLGTVLTLKVRALKSGQATLAFHNVSIYPSDGTGIPVQTQLRTLTLTIESSSPAVAQSGASGGSSYAAPQPNPDLNGDGVVNLVDVSILMLKMISTYDPRFDLNADGKINLSDLAILLSKMTP